LFFGRLKQGTFTNADKDEYTGSFNLESGKFDGEGVLRKSNSEIVAGTFKDS
jgi:hypothetical protein